MSASLEEDISRMSRQNYSMNGDSGTAEAVVESSNGHEPANAGAQAKVTVYVKQSVYKEFKKHAIDEGKTYSQLAELAFEAFLQSRNKPLAQVE